MKKSLLRSALEMLCEGADASIAGALVPEAVEKRAAAKPWIQSDGVQGLGIGKRESGGIRSSEDALKVYVERKLPESKLGEKLVPKEIAFGEMGAVVPTDVEEIGKLQFELDTVRHRPAYPGCGLAHHSDTVGTFGCVVNRRNEPGVPYILSNSHVLALAGLASSGDEIVQPGPLDGGLSPEDIIATLTDFIPFDFGLGFPNLVDAAIALVKDPELITRVFGTINVTPSEVGFARIGTKVKKVGRTTGLTFGEVTDTDFRARIPYKRSDGNDGWAGFRDQVVCTRYTSPGDSGSAVLHADSNKLLGLHFAGSDSISVFNKINHVMDSLQICLPEGME